MKSKTYSDVIQEVKQGFQSCKEKAANWNDHCNCTTIFIWDIFIQFSSYETFQETVTFIDSGNWNKNLMMMKYFPLNMTQYLCSTGDKSSEG